MTYICAVEIEKEIQQRQFSNEFTKALINVMFTSSWFNHQMLQVLKPYGLSHEQFNILKILRGQSPNPATIKQIAERMIHRDTNVSRMVQKLHSRGLVRRYSCESDRRAVDIYITEPGLDLLRDCSKRVARLILELKSLNEGEALALNNLLDKMRG